MPVGFGFSAGDFISALSLVATVIDALRESGESSSEYRALIAQLHTLQGALVHVKSLELDDAQQGDLVIALQQAAAQCQSTIDGFWQRIAKYQPSLREGGSGSRVKDGWMKIRWAVCKKDDLVKFKMDLIGHTESIEILLTTLHFAATRIDSKRSEQRHQTLARKVQDSYFGCMQRINLVIEKVSVGIQQGKQLLEMTAKVIQTNIQIFQIVLNIQKIITRIPGQVERQPPVYLVDALGRHMPFHLEFILSAEALTSVLRANFKNVGTGAKKIEEGEFAIQDAATKKDIDLTSAWETCFTPGQRAEMSMVFNANRFLYRRCPKCEDNNGNTMLGDIEWRTFSLIAQYPKRAERSTLDGQADFIKEEPLPWVPQPLETSKPHDEEEEIALFKRVRISTEVEFHKFFCALKQAPPLGSDSSPFSPGTTEDLLRSIAKVRTLTNQ